MVLENKLMVTKREEGEEGIVREFGSDMYTCYILNG